MMKVIRELIAKFAMKKGIVLPFLLILASVTFILGAFFLLENKPKVINQKQTQSASPSPTAKSINTEATPSVYTDKGSANWKTYINIDFNYSIKYPENWDYKKIDINLLPEDFVTKENLLSLITFSDLYKEYSELKNDPTAWVGIELKTFDAKGKSLQQIVDEERTRLSLWGVKSEKKVKINEREGYLIITGTEIDDPNYNDYGYYFLINDKFYTFYYRSASGLPETIPDQILSTFKFLD